jgi:ABC-type transport system substrate-binding protein
MSLFSKIKDFFSLFRIRERPTRSQWGQFFKALNRRERIAFSVFLILAISSLLFLFINFYCQNTEVVPAEGGTYTEGIVGSPHFINPIYASSSDVDRDLTELIFSGLMKYNEKGEIVPDLAEEYQISEEGKSYQFSIPENLFWSDGQPLTIDDIIFTVETVQNAAFKSPIRAEWLGVKVERLSEKEVSFELEDPSATFLESCTLKILPKHIWQNISSQNFSLSVYNLRPVGSGPYKLKSLNHNKDGEIKSAELVINPNYPGSPPNISKIVFYFFETEEELIAAFQSKKVDGISLTSAEKYQPLRNLNFSGYHLSLPRYFAVFFNLNKPTNGENLLSDEEIRMALNYGTNKEEIVNKVLMGYGQTVDSPILPEVYGFEKPVITYEYNPEKAKEILEEAGFVERENGIREKVVKKEPTFQFKSNLSTGSQGSEVTELQKCLAKDPEVYPEGDVTGYFGSKTKEAVTKFQEKYKEDVLDPYGLTQGTGTVRQSTRAKLNEICFPSTEKTFTLSLSLVTVYDEPDQTILKEVANLLKEQWKALGIELEIQTFDTETLIKDFIKPRSYEMLLFGELLESLPDPFPFWHSSQKQDPGLNLSGYSNAECDKLLEEARQTLNEEERKMALEEFQNILIEDAPAIFLYSPDFLYLVSEKIKGIDTETIADFSKRFSGIENWYIKTKRTWK